MCRLAIFAVLLLQGGAAVGKPCISLAKLEETQSIEDSVIEHHRVDEEKSWHYKKSFVPLHEVLESYAEAFKAEAFPYMYVYLNSL